MGCLNVRGLLNKHDQIVNLMNSCKFGILGLCETFLDGEINEYEYKIKGYSVISKHRNRHGGDVLFYINETVNYSIINVTIANNIQRIWLNSYMKDEQFAVRVMYRPPLLILAVMHC